jgi:hypothetical protein
MAGDVRQSGGLFKERSIALGASGDVSAHRLQTVALFGEIVKRCLILDGRQSMPRDPGLGVQRRAGSNQTTNEH